MENAVDEVAQPDVGESLLGLRRSRRKRGDTASSGVLHCGKPQRRLADARFSFEHERSGP
jgi:hypothetical protein